ncbi:caspase family protein [Streptomyces sp. NPDC005483]|uniref:caspase family protein n=1 Tax=Streptomyces sp. NPDC005483 TaxID=3154882 RepID=UPI0033A7E74A
MTDTGAGRRFLVSIGVSTYGDSAITALPGATVDAERVARLLEPMGYTRVLVNHSANPSHGALVEGLDEWAHDAELGPEDTVVVYFAGHGQKDEREHYLLCSDHRPGLWSTAVSTHALMRPLLRSRAGHLLVVLDTCYASTGTESVAALAAQLTHTHRAGAQRAMIAAARGKETAKENRFVDALEQVLAKPQAGPSQRYLSVREVTERINELLDAERQHASHSVIDSTGQDPFFDNVRYIPAVDRNGLDLAVLAQLQKRHEGHYGPRGKGLEHSGERGDYFTGRTAALGSLAGWLRGPHDRKARVVTGDPGSGKSAVLGRFLDLTDPQHLARAMDPEAAWLPPPGLNAVRLWARRSTTADLVRDLGAAISLPEADLTQLLKTLGERSDRVVVVIDSLDEAGTAGDQSEGRRIARELLQPLSALPAVRLVVGTRRDLIPSLGQAVEVLDLDADDHAREAVTDYARALLLDSHDPDSLSPYRRAPGLANEVAAGIASRAGRSFLVARMNARALVHRQMVVDTGQTGWELSLPSDAEQAFADYLERFGPQRQRVVRLLRPLAYAQGAGLPWSTVWAPLAEALSGKPCGNDDLEWLFEVAGSYITETESAGGSVFRLYHETMAEYLRVPASSVDHQRTIALSLCELAPRDPVTGERDWASAHPYVLTHLASHALAGGVLDRLLTDTEYVVHAEPATLLRALDAPVGQYADKFAAVYRTSAHLLPTATAEARRDILSVDAARYQWQELAERLARGRTWRVAWATGGLVHPSHRRTLEPGRGLPHFISFTVDGKAYALTDGTALGTLQQWDLETGECVRTFVSDEPDTGLLCEVSVKGRAHSLTLALDGFVLRDLLDGTLTRYPGRPDVQVGTARGITVDGRPHVLLIGKNTATVLLWDLTSGGPTLTLTGHTDTVTTIEGITLDGRPHALTASTDTSVRLWDLRTGACTRLFTERKSAMTSLHSVVIDDRPHVLAGDAAGTVRLWDLRTGDRVHTLTGHSNRVNTIDSVTVNGRMHALTGGDETIRAWDLRTGACTHVLTGHTNTVDTVRAVTVNGRPHALSSSYDRSIRLWSLDISQTTAAHDGHTDWVVGVATAVLSNRPHALTVSLDGSARLWDIWSGESVRVLTSTADKLQAVCALSIDDRPHALTGEMGRARLWDLQTGTCTLTLYEKGAGAPYARTVTAVHGVTIDGHPHAIVGTNTGTLELRDLRTGDPTLSLEGDQGSVRAVSGIGIDGVPHALSADHKGALHLWDLRTGRRVKTLAGQSTDTHVVYAITLHLGGHPYALTSRDTQVYGWDLRTGERTHLLLGHTRNVTQISALTIDGRPHALTTSRDATARLWDLRTGECTEVLHLPLRATAAAAVGDQLLICCANDLALFRRTGTLSPPPRFP